MLLLQVGQNNFQVRWHNLHHGNAFLDDSVNEPLHIQNHRLLDHHSSPTDQQRGDKLPERDVEALRCDLSNDLTIADRQIVDFGIKVVDHARVFAHCAFGFAGRAGGEVDVGKLV